MADQFNSERSGVMDGNIAYRTDQLARYFAQNRVSWEQFYLSERTVIDQLQLDPHHTVLDVGCGCGGLGLSLRNRFGIVNYTGVEINTLAANAGRALNPEAQILCGDILDLSKSALNEKCFHVVFSLSCVDWNIRCDDMLTAVWKHVAPGGYLVATFRLTVEAGCSDFGRSYQYINYDGRLEGERAPYVVINIAVLMRQLAGFDPSEILAHGYWGKPSPTAITPYARLCFAAFAIRKRKVGDERAVCIKLNVPEEITNSLNSI